jgi:glycerophosphoryl diester phosphodiesterase
LAKKYNFPRPKFNIEIKSEVEAYNIYQPEPAEFVALVTEEIKKLGIEEFTTLQSLMSMF